MNQSHPAGLRDKQEEKGNQRNHTEESKMNFAETLRKQNDAIRQRNGLDPLPPVQSVTVTYKYPDQSVIPPSQSEVRSYFASQGADENYGSKFFLTFVDQKWLGRNGSSILPNWKRMADAWIGKSHSSQSGTSSSSIQNLKQAVEELKVKNGCNGEESRTTEWMIANLPCFGNFTEDETDPHFLECLMCQRSSQCKNYIK